MIRMDIVGVDFDPDTPLTIRFVGDFFGSAFNAGLPVVVGTPGWTTTDVFFSGETPGFTKYATGEVPIPAETAPFDVTYDLGWTTPPTASMAMYMRARAVGSTQPRIRLTYAAIFTPVATVLAIQIRETRIAFN